MFRITPYVYNSRVLLYHHYPVHIQILTITRSPPTLKYKDPTERETCPPPLPPPPPPPKDDRLLWGTLTVMFLAGGFAVYAKQNPEVRDWLSLYAPWFDDFIALAYQENMTYGEFVTKSFDNFRNCYLQLFLKYFTDPKPKKCSNNGQSISSISEGPKEKEPKETGPKEKASKEKITDVKEEENKEPEQTSCEILPPPVLMKDVCEIETCFRDLGDSIINNYLTARDACAYYNKLVEEIMENFCMKSLKGLHSAMAERIDLVNVSLKNVENATVKIDGLTHYFECGVKAPCEAMKNTRCLMKDYRDKIKGMMMEYEWQNDKSVALDALWQKVEQLMLKYTEENETLFPGLKYTHNKPSMQGDADLLLYHTLRYSQQLQEELKDASAGMTERVNRAVNTLPHCEKEKKIWQANLHSELKRKRADLEKEFKRRYEDLKAANDMTLKEALKKQLARHQENVQTRLLQKEKEVMVKFNKMVAENVATERRMFAHQLKEMAAKLKIVEDKLNERLKAERETRRSQELWAAGASLLAATKKGDPIVKVNKELQAIEKASGDDDKLVMTVLKAIPDSVREKGIVPESVLRERYHVMEKTALKVALVEQDGGPLPIFFLSWLQSILLFMKVSGIPQGEIDKPLQEPFNNLDTFDLLQRARFWIERGNLAAALRYVDSLKGASRAAASSWHDAAKSHLETRQAAEAVLAHAAALGLQYI
ncbi:MICOS complex subunit Mic60-like [Achroia grisella]|uniref:MICOS complex subunit Mic60-like n=1 Tax=Achroia grisella TaxID=688607 RepID=UPI0027D2203F|nr:MICOS complex subunit Mic60-like [Achroia grisella]